MNSKELNDVHDNMNTRIWGLAKSVYACMQTDTYSMD